MKQLFIGCEILTINNSNRMYSFSLPYNNKTNDTILEFLKDILQKDFTDVKINIQVR